MTQECAPQLSCTDGVAEDSVQHSTILLPSLWTRERVERTMNSCSARNFISAKKKRFLVDTFVVLLSNTAGGIVLHFRP